MYWYEFEDGYMVCVKGFSRSELRYEIQKHGKLISQTKA